MDNKEFIQLPKGKRKYEMYKILKDINTYKHTDTRLVCKRAWRKTKLFLTIGVVTPILHATLAFKSFGRVK